MGIYTCTIVSLIVCIHSYIRQEIVCFICRENDFSTISFQFQLFEVLTNTAKFESKIDSWPSLWRYRLPMQHCYDSFQELKLYISVFKCEFRANWEQYLPSLKMRGVVIETIEGLHWVYSYLIELFCEIIFSVLLYLEIYPIITQTTWCLASWFMHHVCQ